MIINYLLKRILTSIGHFLLLRLFEAPLLLVDHFQSKVLHWGVAHPLQVVYCSLSEGSYLKFSIDYFDHFDCGRFFLEIHP